MLLHLFLAFLAVTASLRRAKRQATTETRLMWPEGTVYYQFDDKDTNANNKDMPNFKNFVRAAMDLISENTCINFIQSSAASNRILIQPSGPCDSQVGMIGGVQLIHLGGTCSEMEALHEFIHALGFYHTQNRYDRDSFVYVDDDNIKKGSQAFFRKQNSKNIVPYDLGSIMHYGAVTFAEPSTYSVIPRDQRYLRTTGALQPSFYDFKMINTFYQCEAYCSGRPTPSCQNGGYQNPNKCSSCLCPDGFGGPFCNQRTGCGRTLTATEEWVSAKLTTGTPFPEDYDKPKKCNYWITAPPNTQIQVKFDSIKAACEFGCPFNGFEVKLNKDMKFVQPRYCCSDQVKGNIMLSNSNPTVIVAHQVKMYAASASIQYRYGRVSIYNENLV